MGIPITLSDFILDANRMEPSLVSEGYIEEQLVVLLELLDGSQVEMVVVIVTDDDDVDARQFVQFAGRGCESFWSCKLAGAASVQEYGVE